MHTVPVLVFFVFVILCESALYTRICYGSNFLRICPELNAKKQKSTPTQPKRKKPAMKPRVICQQCGLSLLDRHVLRRHVGFDDTVLYWFVLLSLGHFATI
jgi:hypothetical protein